MTDLLPLWLLAAAVAGGLAMALVGALRGGRDRVRLSLAEAAAQAERARRGEAEVEAQALRQRAEDAETQLAVAHERAERTRGLLDEQRGFVEASRKELEDSFRALAAAALRGSTEQFLALAEQRLGTARVQAVGELEERRAAIEGLVAPLKETLRRLDEKTAELERSRVDAYSRLDQQVRLLATATGELQDRTTSLASALRGSSQARGRWGEVTLRNIAELAGMAEHCDFEEQAGQDGGGRPDMTVRLPGGGKILVDAKAPLAGYLDAAEAPTEAERKTALLRHTRDLKIHIKTLSDRDYTARHGGSIDLVVLFLPGDPILAAAFSQDPELQTDALRQRVLIATPTTLIALLRTVALYWQQRSVMENAEEIAKVARDLYERVAVFEEHLIRVGVGLERALASFNSAVGSFKKKVMPMGQQLEGLKVTEQSRRQLGLLHTIDEAPRRVDEE